MSLTTGFVANSSQTSNPGSTAVVGPGFIGMITAYSLAANGEVTTLVGRPGKTSEAIKQQKYINLASTKSIRELNAMFKADGDYKIPPADLLGRADQDGDLTEIIDGERKISKASLRHKLRKIGAIGGDLAGQLRAKTKKYYTQDEMNKFIDEGLRIPLYVKERDGDEADFAAKQAEKGLAYVRFFDNPEEAGQHRTVIAATKAQDKNAEFAETVINPLLVSEDENPVVLDVANGLKRTIIPINERQPGSKYWDLYEALAKSEALKDLNAYEDATNAPIVGASARFAGQIDPKNKTRIIMKSRLDDAQYNVSDYNAELNHHFNQSNIQIRVNADPVARNIDKLGINLMNIMSATYDMSKKDILEDATTKKLYIKALRELHATMTKFGVQLGEETEFVETTCLDYHIKAVQAAGHSGDIHKPSTQEDIDRGQASTERPFLLDAIIDLSNTNGTSRRVRTVHLQDLEASMVKIEHMIIEGRLSEIKKRKNIHLRNTVPLAYNKPNSSDTNRTVKEGDIRRIRIPRTQGEAGEENKKESGVFLTDIDYSIWKESINPDLLKYSIGPLMSASGKNPFSASNRVLFIAAFSDPTTGEIDKKAFKPFEEGLEYVEWRISAYEAEVQKFRDIAEGKDFSENSEEILAQLVNREQTPEALETMLESLGLDSLDHKMLRQPLIADPKKVQTTREAILEGQKENQARIALERPSDFSVNFASSSAPNSNVDDKQPTSSIAPDLETMPTTRGTGTASGNFGNNRGTRAENYNVETNTGGGGGGPNNKRGTILKHHPYGPANDLAPLVGLTRFEIF